MEMTGLKGADSLQQALLHRPSHAHDFAGGLHLGRESVVGIRELVKRKTGHLGDHIVKSWLKAGGCIGQHDLIQGHSDSDLGGDTGDGIAAGLGSQGGGTGHAGVDLDEIVLKRCGIQGKLDVAAALDLQRPDHPEGAVPEHMVLLVGESLGGTDHDGIPGVDAHRVDIFHVADSDGGVIFVPHDLILDLFEALDALFNQDLLHGRQGQGIFHERQKFLFILRKSPAGAAQGKSRAQDDGKADPAGGRQSFVYIMSSFRGQDRLPEFLTQLLEKFAVLRLLYGTAFGTQQLRPTFSQHTFLLQLHGEVEAGLAPNPRKDGIRALVADNSGDVFQSQRLHIYLVSNRRIRHDRRRIGVAQDHLAALLLQRQTGLGAGIIELRRLPDHDGSRTDHKDFIDFFSLGHAPPPMI